MNKLNDSTIKFISSSYVISSIESLVKELVENSLDAGGSRIWINLKRFGLDKIDVTDDGTGFTDSSLICQRHCTSKISQFSDIETVKTFGFRGEVLSSLCAVSNLSIISNSNSEKSPLGNSWLFDKMGNIVVHNNVSCKQGTTISVSNIFHNIPVRCQMYKSLFILQKTLKSIILNLQHLYLTKKNIHLKLINDNNVILNLPITFSRKDSISFVIGSNKFKYFNEISKSDNICGLEIEMNLFIPNCIDEKFGLTHHDYKESCFLFINNRPVEISCIFNGVRKAYNYFTKQETTRYPYMFLYLILPPSWVDVNFDPEKKKIKLCNENNISDFIETNLKEYYDSLQMNIAVNNAEIASTNAPIQRIDLSNLETPPVEDSSFNDKSNNSSINASLLETTTDKIVNDFPKIPKHINKTSNINYISNVSSSSNTLINENNINEIDDSDQNGSKLDKEKHFIIDPNYQLGKIQSIEGNPVKQVNLKRICMDPIDNSLYNKISKVEKPSTKSLCKPSSECLAHLALDNLNKRDDSIQNEMIANDKLKVIACWKKFVLCLEICSPNDLNEAETQNLIIFSQEKMIFTSIYFFKIFNMPISTTQLQTPFIIDDNYKETLDYLLKLPLHPVSQDSTGETYHVVSCMHLVKNGYKIHRIKTDENDFFKIVSKPVYIDENNILEDINYILLNSLTSTDIVRSSESRRYIYMTSENDTKLTKYEIKSKNLSAKQLREYFTVRMSDILKCRLSERLNEFLPELFRINLNKC